MLGCQHSNVENITPNNFRPYFNINGRCKKYFTQIKQDHVNPSPSTFSLIVSGNFESHYFTSASIFLLCCTFVCGILDISLVLIRVFLHNLWFSMQF